MKPVPDLVSIDELDRAIVNLAARINAERGTMTITVELPLETGELVEKALDKARDDSMSSAEFVDESWAARSIFRIIVGIEYVVDPQVKRLCQLES